MQKQTEMTITPENFAIKAPKVLKCDECDNKNWVIYHVRQDLNPNAFKFAFRDLFRLKCGFCGTTHQLDYEFDLPKENEDGRTKPHGETGEGFSGGAQTSVIPGNEDSDIDG